MEVFSNIVKKYIPDYLSSLPIPNSFGGIFGLKFKEWFQLIPPTLVAAGFGYTAYLAFYPKVDCSKGRCNRMIRLDEKKVVDIEDIENIAEKAAFCRCWKSKNWPYCDGAHSEHNKSTGDNVGPVVVKRKAT